MSLGERVKTHRLAKHMTQRELATALNVNFTYISKIENEKIGVPPSERLIKEMAKVFDTDAETLLILAGKIDYRQLIIDFLDGDKILNRRQLAEAIGGHPLYPEQPPGDYRVAKGILYDPDDPNPEPAEKAVRRLRMIMPVEMQPLIDMMDKYPDQRQAALVDLAESVKDIVEFYTSMAEYKPDPQPEPQSIKVVIGDPVIAPSFVIDPDEFPELRIEEGSDLQAENAALKEVLTALLENWSSYLDADSAGKCGHYCDHCEDYFDPDDSRIPKRPHDPNCPIARAQALLNQK